MPDPSDVKIISLGGSLIAPRGVDASFVRRFHSTVAAYLEEADSRRIILVCGGGTLARDYQKAYAEISGHPEDEALDLVGIAATRLNAELLRQVFLPYCPLPVSTNPTEISVFPGRVLVASGWKPGFSTDNVAVLFAEKFFSDTVINLSNITKVYTDDPKINDQAIPLEEVTWAHFRSLSGDVWEPGKNAPFDPVAAGRAAELGLKVIVAGGYDMANLKALLSGERFEGTVIGPE